MALKATYTNEKGRNCLILGISRGNVDRLIAGESMEFEVPESISMGGKIHIFFGEDEQALVDYLKPMISDKTSVHSDPRLSFDLPKGRKSS